MSKIYNKIGNITKYGKAYLEIEICEIIISLTQTIDQMVEK